MKESTKVLVFCRFGRPSDPGVPEDAESTWGLFSSLSLTHISRKDGIEFNNHRMIRMTETVTLTL